MNDFSFARSIGLRAFVAACTVTCVSWITVNARAQGGEQPPPAPPPAPSPAPAPRPAPPPQPAPAPTTAPPPGGAPSPARRPPPAAAPAPYPQPQAYGPPRGYGPPRDDMPREIDDWEEGDPIPPGYVPRGRMRKGLVIGGSVTLGAVWLITSLTASVAISIEEETSCEPTATNTCVDTVQPEDWAPLYVPVVGPFVAMATLEAKGAGIFVLAIDGLAQAGGLAMLIAGAVTEETVLVRDYSTGFEMSVAPAVGQAMQGIGLTGKF